MDEKYILSIDSNPATRMGSLKTDKAIHLPNRQILVKTIILQMEVILRLLRIVNVKVHILSESVSAQVADVGVSKYCSVKSCNKQ